MNRKKILEILYLNAVAQNSTEPLNIKTIAERMKTDLSNIEQEVKILNSEELVQCDCDWHRLIITRRGLSWLQHHAQ